MQIPHKFQKFKIENKFTDHFKWTLSFINTDQLIK
jgi:hypothetical protein